MKEFYSLFYRKNRLMLFTLSIYSLLAVIFIVVLIVGSFNQYYIQCIGFIIFCLFMAVRSGYFIFEKVVVDANREVIIMKLLKKEISITNIKSIIKIRPGQIRIATADKKQLPISIDNEDDFITLIHSINSDFSVEEYKQS